MLKKETVYLAGKITGDPFYKSKFYEAARELTAAGFIVLDPAMLPAQGFTWEAYMRMSSAMLEECAAVCFLSDWTESRGATWEYGRAAATGKRIFMFEEWRAERDSATPQFIVSDTKTGKLAFKCIECEKISVFPASRADGNKCTFCGGCITPIGYAKEVKKNAEK